MAAVTRASLLADVKAIEENIVRDELIQAEAGAAQLYTQTLIFVRTYQNNSEIPFYLTKKVTEILTLEDIQFLDRLKRLLSQTVALLLEHIHFTCKKQDRAIYPHTRERFLLDLSVLLSTFPKKERTALFAVKCSIAAIHGLIPGQGKWAELAKSQGKEVAKAAMISGAGMSGGAIAGASVDVGFGIYKETANRSYYELLKMKQIFLPIDTLKKVQTEAIQNELKKYNQKPEYALCLAEIFDRIMHYGNEELKEFVFSSEKEQNPGREAFRFLLNGSNCGANLCNIATLKSEKTEFWKGRLRSIEALIPLSKEVGPYQKRSIAILAFRLATEKHSVITKCLYDTYKEQPEEQRILWNHYLRYLDFNDIKAKHQALVSAVSTQIKGVHKTLWKQVDNLSGSFIYRVGQDPEKEEIHEEIESSNSQIKDEEHSMIEAEQAIHDIEKERFFLIYEIISGSPRSSLSSPRTLSEEIYEIYSKVVSEKK